MSLTFFTLTDGSLAVSDESLSIADGSRKRQLNFIYLSIIGPLLAVLIAVNGYNKDSAFLMGTGILILAGYLVLAVMNWQQFRKLDREIPFAKIESVSFKANRSGSIYTVVLRLQGRKKREFTIENKEAQIEELRNVFRQHGLQP